MSDLGECRNRIEEIDLQMAELFEERMKVVKDIAAYKKANGLPIRDPAREEELAKKNSVRVKSDEIRPYYCHQESCQRTVPEAITAFLEGTDFEDVIRTAVSLGGDCDTLTCIAGSIAEAYYGVPKNLINECRARLTPEMLAVIEEFEQHRLPRVARRNG